MSDRKSRLIFHYDIEEVFEATVRAIDDNLSMKINSRDESSGLINASMGVALFSRGEEIIIKVIERRDGNTEIKIVSAEIVTANKYDKNRQKINELMQDITIYLR